MSVITAIIGKKMQIVTYLCSKNGLKDVEALKPILSK